MTMGAGRVIEQDMTRINHALARGELARNPAIQDAFTALAESGGRLHLMGLVSDGGVHSHVKHLEALLALCGERGVAPQVHAFLDGRDTPPDSGLGYLRELLPHVERVGGTVSTVSGRYYAMDRDNRWDRVAEAYHAMVWDRVAAQMREEGIAFERMVMHYTDADLDRWPASCEEAGEPGTEETRRRIRERLGSIEPSLQIEACDADLLEMAGHAVIHAALDREVVARLQREGFNVRDASD